MMMFHMTFPPRRVKIHPKKHVTIFSQKNVLFLSQMIYEMAFFGEEERVVKW